MEQEGGYVSISDASVPNAGRIYDYLLGGNHNFEIDRTAAQKLKDDYPEVVQNMRLIRWFLGEAVRRLCAEGFAKFLDFASGLPTVDHIHYVAPEGTKVVYSDIDPVTVSYGQDIVKGLPNVAFVRADAGMPEQILQTEAVTRLIGAGQKIAIGFSGIAWFLPDEKVAHALKVLYDWTGTGSKLFISDGFTSSTDSIGELAGFFKQVNQPIYVRTEEHFRELIGKWRLCEPGARPLEKWLEIDPSFKQGGAISEAGTLVGAILAKE